MKNSTAIWIILTLLALSVSCATSIQAPPIIVSDITCSTDSSGGLFRFAGIEFSVFNCTDKAIESFEISYRLYDEDRKPLSSGGTNGYSAMFAGTFNSQSSKKLCVNIDCVIRSGNADGILIDYFHVWQVKFSDGSIWENPFMIDYGRNY